MAFSVSPGVLVREIDLTTVIPAVSTSIGAFVGQFEWGPVSDITLISSEDRLVSRFGVPGLNNPSTDFLTATQFLSYTSALNVVRVAEKVTDASSGTTAAANATTSGTSVLALNEQQVEDGGVNLLPGGAFIARYPGARGNDLEVVVLDSTNFEGIGFEADSALFDAAPAGDEIHIVVRDSVGKFGGLADTVLETWAFVQTTEGAKKADGSNNYVKDVLNLGSSFIYVGDVSEIVPGTETFTLGADGSAPGTDEIQFGWDLFKDPDTIDVNLLIVGARIPTIAQYVTQNISEVRKDCVTFISPERDDVVNNSSPLDDVLGFRDSLNLNSSYAVLDSGWKYIYNKHLDRYEWVPLCADTAGLCARTDNDRDPWYSPAGYNRGNIKNVIRLAYNPDKTDRDELYKKGINPVINSNAGPVLFGDKTLLVRPSAFDRINVRRLFIILEKAIATAAKFSLFEFNDQFTRAQFVSLVEPFLREVQARRGIFDFRVVCDETNNTGEVIDTNRFIGDIYLKPARSINFVTLNFVAVRTGVDFSEVVGSF